MDFQRRFEPAAGFLAGALFGAAPLFLAALPLGPGLSFGAALPLGGTGFPVAGGTTFPGGAAVLAGVSLPDFRSSSVMATFLFSFSSSFVIRHIRGTGASWGADGKGRRDWRGAKELPVSQSQRVAGAAENQLLSGLSRASVFAAHDVLPPND
ncbi:hypothetical protein CVV67_01020 [Arthrobacter stackebrandtii]|nr:hypothetical protein CVV67_01020 [Arthrobacter stackebrandtii]